MTQIAEAEKKKTTSPDIKGNFKDVATEDATKKPEEKGPTAESKEKTPDPTSTSTLSREFTTSTKPVTPSKDNLLFSLLVSIFDIANDGNGFTSGQSNQFADMLGFENGNNFVEWITALLTGNMGFFEAIKTLPQNGENVKHDNVHQYALEKPVVFERAQHYENIESNYPGLSGMLRMIRDAEHSVADADTYHTAFGNRSVELTKMTVDQVLEWQLHNNPKGKGTAAAGAYQIIRPTLTGLKDSLGLKGNELFDKNLQDTMAIKLLEQRGLGTDISNTRLLANASKEWASLPKDTSGKSYYDGDGINSAQVDYATAIAAINGLSDDARTSTTQPSVTV